MKFDYLVVGAGLFGSVFAHEAKNTGKNVLVIDKREHIGGNCYTRNIHGINVHQYGAHIFHTQKKHIWEYVNGFCEFNNYINSPVAIYKDEVYNLPFNMNTFSRMWGIKTPKEAMDIIDSQRREKNIGEPENLEEQAISLVGYDIYEKLIQGYTKKQWGRDCKELPAFIIKRLPLRFTYDNNYFTDRYQGIPIGGYTGIFEKLLEGIEVKLSCDFKDLDKDIEYDKLIYTGPIDEYYNYSLGNLSFRSLDFKSEILDCENYQGNAVINYTQDDIPYTRIIEHRHFEMTDSDKTVITYEYPKEWEIGLEPYYPVNDEDNNSLYRRYEKMGKKEEKVIFGGRLGTYKYYDMDMVIDLALQLADKELNR